MLDFGMVNRSATMRVVNNFKIFYFALSFPSDLKIKSNVLFNFTLGIILMGVSVEHTRNQQVAFVGNEFSAQVRFYSIE